MPIPTSSSALRAGFSRRSPGLELPSADGLTMAKCYTIVSDTQSHMCRTHMVRCCIGLSRNRTCRQGSAEVPKCRKLDEVMRILGSSYSLSGARWAATGQYSYAELSEPSRSARILFASFRVARRPHSQDHLDRLTCFPCQNCFPRETRRHCQS